MGLPEWLDRLLAEPPARLFLLDVRELGSRVEESAIVAALAPRAAEAGAALRSPVRFHFRSEADSLSISFEPHLSLDAVVRAFGWEEPVGTSSDVHVSSWKVVPLALAPSWAPVLGPWRIDAHLDDRPRGSGGSRLRRIADTPHGVLDFAGCGNKVTTIDAFTLRG